MDESDNRKRPSFLRNNYKCFREVLLDHKLAALGDAYVNFAYSLAISERRGQPSGAKVSDHILAEALKKACLREHMPKRVSSHVLADAAEAITVYAWLSNFIKLDECVKILQEAENSVEGFSRLLLTIKDRIKF